MPVNSGNKKNTNVYDQRVGAADNAIVLQNGGFLFAPQSPLPNSATATAAQKTDFTTLAIVGAAVVTLFVLFNRKT